MFEISQEYLDDEDIAPYNNNVHWPNLDAKSEEDSEEHDDYAGEGPIDADGYHGDRQSVFSFSDIEGSDEVTSVVDLCHECLLSIQRRLGVLLGAYCKGRAIRARGR